MTDSAIPRRGQRPGDLRFVVRRTAKLPRTLGAPALFSACYGNVGSSIYYALGVTAAVALGLTPFAFILAGFIFVTTALNYVEGTVALPQAGGSSSFARKAFNRPIGFIVGWVQLLNYTATVAISAYTAISYLDVLGRYMAFFRLLDDAKWHVAGAVALTLVLMAINVIGIEESSVLNLVLALLDLATQVVLVVLGVLLLLNIPNLLHNFSLVGRAPTWGNFLASVSIAMVSYTGIETISNMSEEAKNPAKSVPHATYGVIAAVLFVSAFLPTIGISVFPVHAAAGGGYTTDLGTHWANDPVAGIVTAFGGTLANVAGIWVAFLAFTIMVIATNAGLIGISRLSYSLASNRLFPGAFSALHPRFRTPWISILVFGAVAAVLILPNQITLMAAVYSLAATFAFATAHFAVMRLRYVAPDLYRPWRMPLNVRFGHAEIPILSVVGAFAIGSVFTELMAENLFRSTYVYLGWLLLGVVAFVVYRKYSRQPLWEPLETVPHEPRRRPPLAAGPVRGLAPASERVHLGRRNRPGHHHSTLPLTHEVEAEAKTWADDFHAMGPRRTALLALAFVVVSVAAVALDLSPYDPFGPRLGWSIGVIIVTFFSGLLLFRSRRGL